MNEVPDTSKAAKDAGVGPTDQAGEDDASTSVEGRDDHLHGDQKPLNTMV